MESKVFYNDLRKIQDQYNYKVPGHGSVDICDLSCDGKRIAGVNWSACGTQNPKYAKAFVEALTLAIDACEHFNETHDLNDI